MATPLTSMGKRVSPAPLRPPAKIMVAASSGWVNPTMRRGMMPAATTAGSLVKKPMIWAGNRMRHTPTVPITTAPMR